ncbi:MAG: hydroxyphenylacetyl-CoA thioesterase PaaI [Deinococcales bacterium]
MSYAEFLGLAIISVTAGKVEVQAKVEKHHLNLHGSAHGGFLYSLADEAFALASNRNGQAAVALSVHMEYFKAVREGDVIRALVSEDHLGRRTASYRIELLRGEERVALFQGMVYKPV